MSETKQKRAYVRPADFVRIFNDANGDVSVVAEKTGLKEASVRQKANYLRKNLAPHGVVVVPTQVAIPERGINFEALAKVIRG